MRVFAPPPRMVNLIEAIVGPDPRLDLEQFFSKCFLYALYIFKPVKGVHAHYTVPIAVFTGNMLKISCSM